MRVGFNKDKKQEEGSNRNEENQDNCSNNVIWQIK